MQENKIILSHDSTPLDKRNMLAKLSQLELVGKIFAFVELKGKEFDPEYWVTEYHTFEELLCDNITVGFPYYKWYIDPYKNFRLYAKDKIYNREVFYEEKRLMRLVPLNVSEATIQNLFDSVKDNDIKRIKYFIDHYTVSLGRLIYPHLFEK